MAEQWVSWGRAQLFLGQALRSSEDVSWGFRKSAGGPRFGHLYDVGKFIHFSEPMFVYL